MKSTHCFAIVLFVLSLSACNLFKKSGGDSQQASVITDRRWKLVELEGKPVADKVNGKEPFIHLKKKDSTFSATGGCNGMGGTYTFLANGRIKFEKGMSTMMACENMEVEIGLTRVLLMADNYSLSGDNLSLNKARMAPLARFKAVK
jgi:heat shock protein HslJ